MNPEVMVPKECWKGFVVLVNKLRKRAGISGQDLIFYIAIKESRGWYRKLRLQCIIETATEFRDIRC